MLNILPWISGLIPFASHKIHTKYPLPLCSLPLARDQLLEPSPNPKPGINYYIEIADSASIQLQAE
jgi:hypothetical protein